MAITTSKISDCPYPRNSFIFKRTRPEAKKYVSPSQKKALRKIEALPTK